MPRPDPLSAAVVAEFLAELRGGALVEAAALKVGVGLGTLYRRRRRDYGFDLAWTAAARASRDLGTGRRIRFAANAKALFVETLAGDCNTTAAAGRTGVHPSTVHRHLRRDEAFAGECRAALLAGFERLAQEWEAERAGRIGRLRARLDSGHAATLPERDFETQLRLLDRYLRPDGSIAARSVRWPAERNVWTFERAIVALDRALDRLGPARERSGLSPQA